MPQVARALFSAEFHDRELDRPAGRTARLDPDDNTACVRVISARTRETATR